MIALEGRFTVRVWDGIDGCWCDVITNVDRETALRTWAEETRQGTYKTSFHDLDYYRIFPADTHMLYDGENPMFDTPE